MWLRTNMGDEHNIGLVLLNIHKSIAINIDDIISRFRETKQKKLNFVI